MATGLQLGQDWGVLLSDVDPAVRAISPASSPATSS